MASAWSGARATARACASSTARSAALVGWMASLLAPYGSPAALMVARDMDAKIEILLKTAAG